MATTVNTYLSLQQIYGIVRDAILNKHGLAICYEGKPVRHLCPHVLGLNKNDEYQMLGYQFSGYSSSGLGPDGSPSNWRCIALGSITSIEPIKLGHWHTAPNHSRSQTCVKEEHVKVKI